MLCHSVERWPRTSPEFVSFPFYTVCYLGLSFIKSSYIKELHFQRDVLLFSRTSLSEASLCSWCFHTNDSCPLLSCMCVHVSTKCVFRVLCVSSDLCFIVQRFWEGSLLTPRGASRHASRLFATLAPSKTPFSAKHLNLEDKRAKPFFFFTFLSSDASDGQPSG